jgi:hypothetical protein
VIHASFNGAVAFVTAVAFFSSIYHSRICHSRICSSSLSDQFLLLNPLLTFSRILFFISDILIIMRQYEYHVRFALSVAQLFFSFIIAIVIASPMVIYAFNLDFSKIKSERPSQEITSLAQWKYADVAVEHKYLGKDDDSILKTVLSWSDKEVSARMLWGGVELTEAQSKMENGSFRATIEIKPQDNKTVEASLGVLQVEEGEKVCSKTIWDNTNEEVPNVRIEFVKDNESADIKVYANHQKLKHIVSCRKSERNVNFLESVHIVDCRESEHNVNFLESAHIVDCRESEYNVNCRESEHMSFSTTENSELVVTLKKGVNKMLVSVYRPEVNGRHRYILNGKIQPISAATNVLYSKPKKFTDFRPRKPSNQLAKLHHNSNRPTWMKWKRTMGSDSYNPTNI